MPAAEWESLKLLLTGPLPECELALSPDHAPGAPPLSGTLAVIKAQAFGALRRTRSRAKKGADSAAKVALEALEARGIDMGVSTGSKRARVDYDEDDDAD